MTISNPQVALDMILDLYAQARGLNEQLNAADELLKKYEGARQPDPNFMVSKFCLTDQHEACEGKVVDPLGTTHACEDECHQVGD